MQINMGSNIALIFTQYIICHTFIFILLIINGLLWLLFNFSHPQTHFTGYKVTWNNGKFIFHSKMPKRTSKWTRNWSKMTIFYLNHFQLVPMFFFLSIYLLHHHFSTLRDHEIRQLPLQQDFAKSLVTNFAILKLWYLFLLILMLVSLHQVVLEAKNCVLDLLAVAEILNLAEDWGAGLTLDLTCLEDLHSASNFEFDVAHFLPEPVAVSGPPKI